MADVVLVSTHDLESAGALRAALVEGGFGVDLVTPGENIRGLSDAVLLVLTGGFRSGTAGALADQAAGALSLPVFAVTGAAEEDRAATLALRPDETFTVPVDPAEVTLLARRLVERRRLQQLTGIVGDSEAIQEALERVVQIAPVNSTVLITGESGTGKELVARGIHLLSSRKHKPFIAVNVAALPQTLLESELFGHEKGAFTGAIDSRKGFFELANGGTIFLDEIGEMPLATQTKLLRVLEQREFVRVGGEVPTKVDVRIIAATNRNLRRDITTGDFRRDLYYRLNVLSITLPPLRERRSDIPLLIREFVRELTARHDRAFVGISTEAMHILEGYSWPGNVRELQNLVESMVVLAPGREIRPEDIPEEVRGSGRRAAIVPVRDIPRELATLPEAERGVRPELEFIFRTLVDLRVDMDELRREFDRYREGQRDWARIDALPTDVPPRPVPPGSGAFPSGAREIVIQGPADGAGHEAANGDAIVFEPGMTMEDLERRAIEIALERSGGNRRKAAETLGIGERTLYRKIQKFELDV